MLSFLKICDGSIQSSLLSSSHGHRHMTMWFGVHQAVMMNWYAEIVGIGKDEQNNKTLIIHGFRRQRIVL